VAHWLKDRGFDAVAVRGGVAALSRNEVAEGNLNRDGSARVSRNEAGVSPASTAASIASSPEMRALTALRWPRFRRFSIGVLLSLIGNAVEAAAFGYVVLLLGGSAAMLGLVGFLNTIPNLLLGLPAGVLADRYDRRTLLFVFQGLNMGVAVLLAVLWATDQLTVAILGAIAVVGGSLGTLSFPAFQGMLASTVPRRDLESAVAINSLSLQVARFVGPAIAGVLLAQAGPTWVFGFNAASFVFVLGALALLPGSRAAVSSAGRTAAGFGASLKEGLQYVFGQRSLASLMLLLLLAGVFATPPVTFMIPGIVEERLGGGAGRLGALLAAIGVGSLLGSIALLRLSRRPNKGEPAIAGFLLAGAAIAGVGLSTSLPLSLVLGILGGLGGVLFVGLSTVVVQAASSDEMRARAMAIWAAFFVGVLPIGALITAGLAALIGAGGAVLVDGIVVFVGGIAVLLLRPEVSWLGCAALPEACLAATSPAAVAEADRLAA
jgi:MFS family permease